MEIVYGHYDWGSMVSDMIRMTAQLVGAILRVAVSVLAAIYQVANRAAYAATLWWRRRRLERLERRENDVA